MKEKIESIKSKLLDDLVDVKKLQDVVDIKAKYIGKSGLITELTKNMKDLSVDERKEIGKLSNELKNDALNMIQKKEENINLSILNEKLKNEVIDISLSSTKIPVGSPNILEKVITIFF